LGPAEAIDPAYIRHLAALTCDHRRADVVRNLMVDAADAASPRAAGSRKGRAEGLCGDFITEASRLYGDALTHQTEEITGRWALRDGRAMRLASTRE
jgi:hypothetical protein